MEKGEENIEKGEDGEGRGKIKEQVEDIIERRDKGEDLDMDIKKGERCERGVRGTGERMERREIRERERKRNQDKRASRY